MDFQTLTIDLDGTVIEAKEGDNLLSSLLDNKVDVRFGCRAGACGACRLYECESGNALLSCQTSVSDNVSLTAKAPVTYLNYSLLSKKNLDDSNVALTLLGPSDDSFGDRVTLCFPLPDNNECVLECMAVNGAGEPLTVVVQKAQLPFEAWSSVLALELNNSVQVSSESGVRKGRLLYELGLDNTSVVLVSSTNNAVFEPYWKAALAELSSVLLAYYLLPKSNELHTPDMISCLEGATKQVSSSSLQIIYHGQKLSEKHWEQLLRPLRIRTNQLHFIR